MIALTFALLAVLLPQLPIWGQGVALVVALFVLAGRQLALGILTHDAAHSSLFARPWLNDHVADWLCARPVWSHLAHYRAYHLRHHVMASVPYFRLPQLHQLLRQRGYVPPPPNYWPVFGLMSSKAE